jgi:cyanophycinase-like exopeptidase
MSGTLALIGGQEHMPGSEPIDRMLLRDIGVSHPHVTVVLAGTSPRRRAFKINEAETYWAQLGGHVSFVFTGAPDETDAGLTALADPDLVVFTGGHPWLFHQRLDQHPQIVDRILDLSNSGVPLAGSSAGAMAMCEWRQRMRPPRPLQLVRALGLVPRSAVAPHFPRYGIPHVASWAIRRHPFLRVLGLQDQTALVGRNGRFQVVGTGTVTVLGQHGPARYEAGAEIHLR